MKALDTNVLVRFLVRDDKRQAETIYRIFKCDCVLTFDKRASNFRLFELLC
jgi:predicted nucleic acid-binding protein